MSGSFDVPGRGVHGIGCDPRIGRSCCSRSRWLEAYIPGGGLRRQAPDAAIDGEWPATPEVESWRADMSDQRVVLITGASSGVGQSTARLLSERGYKVFGTSRNPARAEPMPAFEMLPLDVRADGSVREFVDA